MIGSWLELKAAGVPIGFADMLGMGLRKTYSRGLIHALIAAHSTRIPLTAPQLEAHVLAGGRVEEVVKAAIVLQRSGESIACQALLDVDLRAGRVLELAKSYVTVKERYPALRFDELVRRHLDGEDVIGSIANGELAPEANQSSWAVRAEYEFLTPADVEHLLRQLPRTGRAFVRRPGRGQWEQTGFDDAAPR